MARSNVKIELDHAGLGQILKSQGDLIAGPAARVAAAARAHRPGLNVVVETGTSDRSYARVVIKDPRGRIYQVRDGVLTKAAAGAGLEVRGWK